MFLIVRAGNDSTFGMMAIRQVPMGQADEDVAHRK